MSIPGVGGRQIDGPEAFDNTRLASHQAFEEHGKAAVKVTSWMFVGHGLWDMPFLTV